MPMDPLSAHLDRGWDLVQKGDLRAARAAALRALESDRESPEVHNLLGFIATQEGDPDAGLEHYRTAMSLDDGYVDPMLNAAEVLIHPLHEYDQAVELCDEVLEFAETREEKADALLLKFDALLASGNGELARTALRRIPEGPWEGPTYPFLLGRALFESGQAAEAEPLLRQALERDPHNADVHYYLGLVLEERQDRRAAALAFLEARELDLHAAAPPWSLQRDAFHQCVQKALGRLEPEAARHLDDALVLVSDVPGLEIVCDGVDPRIPVLLDGIKPPGGPGPLAARVIVYQHNVERLCGGVEQLEDELALQLAEEIKHVLAHADRETPGSDRPGGRGGPVDPRGRDATRDRERDKSETVEEPRPSAPPTRKP